MTIKKLIGNLLLVGITMTSCTRVSNVIYVHDEYKDKKLTNISVLVIPYVAKAISAEQRMEFIARKSTQGKTVTRGEIELIENNIKSLLTEHIIGKVTIHEAEFQYSNKEFSFQDISYNGAGIMEMYVPKSKIEYKGEVPDFLFIVEDIYFVRDAKLEDVSLGRGSNTSYKFGGGIEYLLWDNKQGKTAAYGKLSREHQLFEFPQKQEYISLLDEFLSMIIDISPLYKKEIRL